MTAQFPHPYSLDDAQAFIALAAGEVPVDKFAVAVFVGPITYIGVTLLYYDIRIRKEGFDIEMLARSL